MYCNFTISIFILFLLFLHSFCFLFTFDMAIGIIQINFLHILMFGNPITLYIFALCLQRFCYLDFHRQTITNCNNKVQFVFI